MDRCSTVARYLCQSSVPADENGRWIIEGHGVDPDIVVEQDPVQVLKGHDPQLERGVEELMKRLPASPAGLPQRPAAPIKNRGALSVSEIAILGLARSADAREIAEMSRDLIEQGLTWSWTPARVQHFISGPESSVVVARRERRIAAFAIMHFGDEVAHLNLLAVAPEHRRQGLGRQIMDWLTATAVEAGVFRINLELRTHNEAARVFYLRLGFDQLGVVQGYYPGPGGGAAHVAAACQGRIRSRLTGYFPVCVPCSRHAAAAARRHSRRICGPAASTEVVPVNARVTPQLIAQDVDGLDHSRLPRRRQAHRERTCRSGCRAHRARGLGDILAGADAAVEHHFAAAVDRGNHLLQHRMGRRRPVQLPPAMIGHDDGVGPGGEREPGVLRVQHTLEDELSGPAACAPIPRRASSPTHRTGWRSIPTAC